MPSLSSSPWIRGAPHNGLAMLISRINCPDLSWHRWTASTTPGLPAPKQSEACMVPPNHGIGSNDGERVAGVRKQVADPTQNEPVDGQKWHPIWLAPTQDDDLLFEH